MTLRLKLIGAVSLVAVVTLAAMRVPSAFSHAEDPTLPFTEAGYVLTDDLDAYVDFMISGGPPPDGIPAIDDGFRLRGGLPEASGTGRAH